MSVRIDNFVSVNITRRTAFAEAEYDTAVLVKEGPASNGYYTLSGGGTMNGSKENPYSAQPYMVDNTEDEDIRLFFENGGKCLHLVSIIDVNSESGTGWFVNGGGPGKELPLNEVVIFGSGVGQPVIGANPTEGIYQKLILAQVENTSVQSLTRSGLVYKINVANNTGDVCAATAAYYTKILLNDARTIRDYMFTAETVDNGSQLTDDTDVKACIQNNINCDAYLAGSIRNIGGNDSTGEDITNLFMRIVLQQVLSNTLLNLLASKIKINQSGVISVKNACSAALQRFVNNGYIDTEKLWTEPDLYVDNEFVVAQDTPITGGYLVHVGKITKQNIADRQIPNVYILYGDSVGVRKIVVSGEVF